METTGNIHKLAAQIAKARKMADAMALSQQPEEYWNNPPLEAWKIIAEVVKIEPPSSETVLLAQTIYKERKVGERLLTLKSMEEIQAPTPFTEQQKNVGLVGRNIRGVEIDTVAKGLISGRVVLSAPTVPTVMQSASPISTRERRLFVQKGAAKMQRRKKS